MSVSSRERSWSDPRRSFRHRRKAYTSNDRPFPLNTSAWFLTQLELCRSRVMPCLVARNDYVSKLFKFGEHGRREVRFLAGEELELINKGVNKSIHGSKPVFIVIKHASGRLGDNERSVLIFLHGDGNLPLKAIPCSREIIKNERPNWWLSSGVHVPSFPAFSRALYWPYSTVVVNTAFSTSCGCEKSQSVSDCAELCQLAAGR